MCLASVKELDLTTGNVLKNIYTANDNVIIKTIVINKNDIASYNINNLNKPTQFGVAITAFYKYQAKQFTDLSINPTARATW